MHKEQGSFQMPRQNADNSYCKHRCRVFLTMSVTNDSFIHSSEKAPDIKKDRKLT